MIERGVVLPLASYYESGHEATETGGPYVLHEMSYYDWEHGLMVDGPGESQEENDDADTGGSPFVI